MMKIKTLITKWQNESSSPITANQYSLQLSIYDAARVEALHEMFPEKSKQQIMGELLSSALDEVEEAFAYEQGDKVIARDEFDDPMYEDVGLTSTFIDLTNQYVKKLKSA